MPGTYSPEREIPQGSVGGGILGALLGAAAGAIPYGLIRIWQLPDLGTTDLWEALGLIVGYCACVGYRGLKGRRSTVTGAVIIVLSAAAAFVCANLAAELYTLSVALSGRDALLAAIHKLIAPERRMGLAVGFVWGLVGVWSARSYLLWYTAPERAVRKYGEAVLQQTFSRQELPQAFTVRSRNRWMSLGGVLCALLFSALLAAAVTAFDPAEEGGWLLLCVCLCPLGTVGGIWSALRRWNCRLEVIGEYLRYVSAVGSAREFYVRDIYGLGRSALTGVYKFYDREGWFLGWFDPDLENGTLLVQYLRERGIGLGVQPKT